VGRQPWFEDSKNEMPHSEVIISHRFRGGTLSYREGDHEIPFDWELCGSRAAVMIWGTKRPTWDINHPWAAGRQSEIYDFVAKEMIRQKAGPASNFKIDLESGTMTIL
jgi:hypothetical protein